MNILYYIVYLINILIKSKLIYKFFLLILSLFYKNSYLN